MCPKYWPVAETTSQMRPGGLGLPKGTDCLSSTRLETPGDAMPVDPLMLEAAPRLSSSLPVHQVFCPAQVRARLDGGPVGGMRLPELRESYGSLLLSTGVLSSPLLSQHTSAQSRLCQPGLLTQAYMTICPHGSSFRKTLWMLQSLAYLLVSDHFLFHHWG